MILIADSGSTKTNWCILDSGKSETHLITTAGINPFYQDSGEMVSMLKKEFSAKERDFQSIYFYGAGCANPDVIDIVKAALSEFFKSNRLVVGSDLLGAAHSLCGNSEGIACILGTGSNSCHYDGEKIVKNVSPLGFILGDEGSGAVIGKRFLADLLKNQLPEPVEQAFFDHYDFTPAQLMDNIYKKPFPNRFAAQFTRFIAQHIEQPSLDKIVMEAFDDFFKRNVLQYHAATSLPVHFTGSIAWHFKPQLMRSATSLHLNPGRITADPMPGLIQYHQQKQ